MSLNGVLNQNIFKYTDIAAIPRSFEWSNNLDAEYNRIISFNSQSEDDANDDIKVIAHRGYSEAAPENTIPAFIAAAENGYDTIECDVSWTKDSVPVILHDETINRTARKENGRKFIFKRYCSNYTYDELLKYDFGSWKGEEFKGTKIPSFDEMLGCCKNYDLNMYIELKENIDFDEKKAQILVDAVKDAGLEDKVTWISFNSDYLKTISDIMPDCRLGYLSKKKPTEDTIDILEWLKTDNNEVFLDVKTSKMSEKASELLNESGFDFEVWTVDDSSDLDELYSYDCKGITTNSLTEKEVDEYLDSICR